MLLRLGMYYTKYIRTILMLIICKRLKRCIMVQLVKRQFIIKSICIFSTIYFKKVGLELKLFFVIVSRSNVFTFSLSCPLSDESPVGLINR